MSDHERHTEFLRQCISYDEGDRRQELAKEIVQIQCNARCVQRAVWLMALLTALIAAGLAYPLILVDNFPYDMPQSAVNIAFALGMGLLISLLAFVGLGMIYRGELDRRWEECRQLVTQLLESRLGKPFATPLRDTRGNRAAGEIDRTVRDANEVDGSPVKIESAVQG